MIDHLLAIKDAVAAVGATGLRALSPSDSERFLKRCQQIVKTGYSQNPSSPAQGAKRRGRRKQSKARNLLDRFRDHPDSILAFMRDFAAPPSCRRSTPRDHRPTYRTNLSANFAQVAARYAAAT